MSDREKELEREIARLRAELEHLRPPADDYTAMEWAWEVINRSIQAVLVFDDRGHILFANKAFQELSGYHYNELSLLRLHDIVLAEDFLWVMSELQELEAGEWMEDFNLIITTRAERKRRLHGLVMAAPQGNRLVFEATLTDITENPFKHSGSLYQRLVEAMAQDFNQTQLYHAIHGLLQEVIGGDAFMVLLRDQRTGQWSCAYHTRSLDAPEDIPANEPQALALVEYLARFPREVFFQSEAIAKMAENARLPLRGGLPAACIVVPMIRASAVQVAKNLHGHLQAEDYPDAERLGAIAVLCYDREKNYDKKLYLRLLNFVAQQISGVVERVIQEEALQKQTARLEAIIESGTHFIWAVNRDLQLTRFNTNFAVLAEKLLAGRGRDVKIYTQLPIFEVVRQHYWRAFWQEKYAVAFSGEHLSFPVHFVLPDGQQVWKEVFLNPIIGKDGSVEEVSAIAHDITQMKLTEQELRRNHANFKAIIDSFQDVYFQTDLEGRFHMVTPSSREQIGMLPHQLIGQHISQYYIEQANFQQLLRELIEKGKVRNYETVIRDTEGHVKSILSNFRLIFEGNRPVLIECVAKDITDLRRAAEQLRQAKELAERSLEVKRRFLSNMSHEIRTPLNGLIGNIDLLLMTKLSDDQRESVLTMKRSSETLLNILNDILDLSKIEAGKMELRKAPVSLVELLDKIKALFGRQAYNQNTLLETRVATGVPAWVVADETRLLQILSNLTSNAIKFTPNGRVEIYVEHAGPNQLRFEVRDNGIGISAESQALLFQQFSQVDNSYTKSHGGTGLGLVISQELCRLMHGQIGVQSAEGKGSTFWFTVEAETYEGEIPNTPEEKIQLPDLQHLAPWVLLVDDNLTNQAVSSRFLQAFGCKVDIAIGGPQAIEMVRYRRYDLILMDIQMPRMNGVTATRHIREILQDKCPPVIAMTAFSMQEERTEFLANGMDDFIAKPIKVNTLGQIVQHWLVEKNRPLPIQPTLEQPVKASSGTIALLNTDVLEHLRQYMDEADLKDTYSDFVQEAIGLVQQCRKAVAQQDIPALLAALHTLKGASGTLGAGTIEDHCRRWDEILRHTPNAMTPVELARWASNQGGVLDDFKENYKKIIEKSNRSASFGV